MTHLDNISVVVGIVRYPLVINSLAGEAAVTETVSGSEDPELVDEGSSALVWCRAL